VVVAAVAARTIVFQILRLRQADAILLLLDVLPIMDAARTIILDYLV
jgi:hypothetical protein